MSDKKFCPVCQSRGMKSCITREGWNITSIDYDYFYDEEGTYHLHNPNIKNCFWKCTQGHKWLEKSGYNCVCGWSKEVEKPIEILKDNEDPEPDYF